MQAIRYADPQKLTEEILAEVIRLMNLRDKRVRRQIATRLIMAALPRFAAILAEFDRRVLVDGFPEGVRWLLPFLQMQVTASGAAQIPTEGPLLLASNHPGAGDFLAIFANVPRDDARLVAAVSLLDLLPNVLPHIVFTSRVRSKRRKPGETTQKLIDELKAGNTVLIYPRGVMEPDPRWSAGARESLALWRPSIERFAAAVPELTVVPTLVSGTLSRRAITMRWLNFYRSERFRQRTAVFTQIAMSMIRPHGWETFPHVAFGTPVRAADVPASALVPLVQGEMQRMLTHSRAPDWPLRSGLQGWTDEFRE